MQRGLESEARRTNVGPAGHGKESQVEGRAWRGFENQPREGEETASWPFCFLTAHDSWYPGEARQERCGRDAVRGEVSSATPIYCYVLPSAAPSHTHVPRSWRSRAENNAENLRPGLWNGQSAIYKQTGLNNGATAASVTGSVVDLWDSGKPQSQTPEETAQEGED